MALSLFWKMGEILLIYWIVAVTKGTFEFLFLQLLSIYQISRNGSSLHFVDLAFLQVSRWHFLFMITSGGFLFCFVFT